MALNYPLDIYFATAGLPFDGDTIKNSSLGGSESAALYMARALARRGHRVKHFTNAGVDKQIDGVHYLPLNIWPQFSADAHHDVSIVQRNPQAMVNPINAKLSVLWQHDLALKRFADVHRATKWRTDKTFLLSQFHVEQYKQVIGMNDREIYQTRNGFDFSLQPKINEYAARDKNLFVYCARPERGLEHVLNTVFPAILEKNPAARLAVCTYDNQMPELAAMYAHLAAKMQTLPVDQLGHLTKKELYALLNRAVAYLYPTPGPAPYDEFKEISCIAAIEAQACGLPFIHTGTGALSETLPQSDLTRVSVDNMAEAALALSNGINFAEIQALQFQHVKRYDWDIIASEWESSFFEWIAERNDSLPRLAQWFYRRSEIEGVRECIKRADQLNLRSGVIENLRTDLKKHYWFTRDESSLTKHYNQMGKGIYADLSSRREVFTTEAVMENQEPRFQMLLELLKDAGIKTLFDAGCGHGWSSLFFANNLNLSVIGFDVDPLAAQWATELREQVSPNAKAHFFNSWEKAKNFAHEVYGGKLDACVCSEVLEHVIDPNAFIDQCETYVKPGGLVIITVPIGPWEFDGPNWHGLGRCHIREFSQACIYEMFGHKTNFRCGSVRTAHHASLGDPLGFYIVSWTADGQPSRKRDIERMMKIQRPTETLSVNIIAGPGSEKNIQWTLDSIKSIADEIIVGDCGMSNAAREACESHHAIICDAPLPLVDGFASSRNAVLDQSECDWILWIDTDERLIQPESVRQYLRLNQSNGYAIRQIHAAVDEQINHDTPVRLFRRASGNRFIGLIHEHPELGVNKGPGNVCIMGGYPAIWHLGYETNAVRGRRFSRNRPLVERDRRENPDRVLGMFLDIRDQILMMQEYTARNNNNATPQSVAHAKKALDLCREFEAADLPLMGINIETYRTDALRHLGLGFDAKIEIKLARDGVGDSGQFNLRFTDEDELRSYIKKQIDSKMERLRGPYW